LAFSTHFVPAGGRRGGGDKERSKAFYSFFLLLPFCIDRTLDDFFQLFRREWLVCLHDEGAGSDDFFRES